MMSFLPLILGALVASVPAAHPHAPLAAPTDPGGAALESGEGRRVAATVADELVAKFVLPTNAKDYAAMLRTNSKAGRYDHGTRTEVALRITDDLLAVHKDGHLRVSANLPDQAGGRRGGPPKDMPPLIQSAKWLAPGIAYIRPTAFFGTKEEIADFEAFMREHKDARTMIFDLRNHHGGGVDEMNVIMP